MLAEGQRDGDIEVLEIDEKAGNVKVNNFGIPQTIDFNRDIRPIFSENGSDAAEGHWVRPANGDPS